MKTSKAVQSSPAGTGPEIIAADDDGIARRLISHRLSRDGFRVSTCGNGEELLILAAKTKPVVLILDMMMPIMDGYSTLKALKSNPHLASVPVLVLSGKNQQDHIARCFDAGAADYMVKPFNPEELSARVHKLASHATPLPHP